MTLLRHHKRRLGDLAAVVAATLAECHAAQLQPDGSIHLVLANPHVSGQPVEPDSKSDALRILWMRFSCFSLEGSHVRLKRMLRNRGGG